MSFILVIPARYSSKRFPGKPLKKINGIEMISHVWRKCTSAIGEKNVLIATDSNKILNFCKKKSYNVILTSKKCLTGTDRIYEVSKKIKKDIYINVQGDEPLISISDIKKFVNYEKKNRNEVINAYTNVKNSKDYFSLNVPKLVFNNSKKLMYMSRSNIPGNKKNLFSVAYKQVCIYSFPYNQLKIFGKTRKKTEFENIEDIEILRFLELGIAVKMFKVSSSSIGVDTESDLKKVERIIIKNDKLKRNNIN